MKLITMDVKDLNKLLKTLMDHGYQIERGVHAVLLDNSEVEEIYVKKSNEVKAVIVTHYITSYYKAIVENYDKDDKELLQALIKVKYSGDKWASPVNPVALLTEDNELINILDNYEDKYPSEEAKYYVEYYRKNHPESNEVFSGLLARVLEKISS